jgi:hypothetical protein
MTISSTEPAFTPPKAAITAVLENLRFLGHFAWLDGKTAGERVLCAQYLDLG